MNRSKNLSYLLLLLLPALLLQACKRDFLGPDPRNEGLTKDVVFSNITNAQKELTNAYSGIYTGFSIDGSNTKRNLGYAMLSSYCDESVNSFTWADSWSVNSGAWGPTFNDDDIWSPAYASIRVCNIFMASIDGVPEVATGDNALKIRMKAEARFLRAYYYFELIKRYGGVPIINDVLSLTGDLDLARNSWDECVSFITADCDTAALDLPTQYASTDIGRVTKGAALALKAKTLLYNASPLHNSANDAGKWQSAAAAAKTVIDMKLYNLYPDYRQLFLTPNNQEIIFSRQDFSNYGLDDPYQRPNGNTGGWGGTNPTVNFIDHYEMDNGKLITDPTSGYSDAAPLDHRDKRLYQTVTIPGETWMGQEYQPWDNGVDSRNPPPNTSKGGDGTWTGFNLKKFLDEGYNAKTHCWPILRMGEIYLDYAEAQNEASGPDQSVYDAINLVRARPTVGQPALPSGLSKSDMRNRIRNERCVELAFEEQRIYDVRRWQIGAQTQAGSMYCFAMTLNANGTITYKRQAFQTRTYVAPKMDLYPIPQTETAINKNLTQNPGW